MAWRTFENTFIQICDKHAPFKRFKIPNRTPNWFNDEYLALRREVEMAKNRAGVTKSQLDWENFRHLRNRINNFAKKLKRDFFESSINEAGSDTKNCGRQLKQFCPLRKMSK